MDENNELRLEGLDGCAVEWIGNEKGIPWRYRGMLCVRFTLPAGGAKEFYVAFCRKASAPGIGAYEEEKKKAAAFWLGELEKISVFPKKENKKYYTMYRTLVANSLQMFACPKGENYVIPRQGCTQNNIWPAEAYEALKTCVGKPSEGDEAMKTNVFKPSEGVEAIKTSIFKPSEAYGEKKTRFFTIFPASAGLPTIFFIP